MSSRQMRSFRVDAVVLRHSDWGEADRLISLYSREQGKIRALAKGARKLRSRKAGHLEPFTHVSLQLARGRDLYIITQADTLDAYLNLRQDLELVGYASYVIELLDRFTYDEDENRGLHRLLVATLSRLEREKVAPALTIHYYEIRLLDLLGYRPELFHCAVCEAEIQPEDQYFSAAQGGVLCPRCGPRTSGARPLSMHGLRYLRHFQRSNFQDAARARLSHAVEHELESLMQHYLTYLLERSLNSPAFLRRVRKKTP